MVDKTIRIQRFLDQPHDAPIGYAVLDEPHQASVIESVKNRRMSALSTQFTFFDANRQRIQRLMRAASRSEAIRETQEVLFEDRSEHLDGGALDDFVFQRGNPSDEARPGLPTFGM